jgi:hypothetical protein
MVITSEMNSRDATALTRESVDISSVLSFDNQISFGGADEKEGDSSPVSFGGSESGGDEEKGNSTHVCCGGKLQSLEKEEEGVEESLLQKAAPFLLSVNVGVKTKHTRSSLSSSEKKDTVKSKITKTSTVSTDLLFTSRVNTYLMSLSQYTPFHMFSVLSSDSLPLEGSPRRTRNMKRGLNLSAKTLCLLLTSADPFGR